MGSFVNVPTFTAKQILTAALLNQLVTALQGFSAQSADIGWPLTMGDNLDADGQYTIVNMPTLWNIVNANEYPDPKLSNAITAVNNAGGGCVLIPPDTPIDGTTGVTITASNVWVIGCGMSSVVSLTSGTGPLFDTANNLSNIGFMNCRLTESAGTSSADGIVFRRSTSPRLINVLIDGFDGDSVYYTSDGTDGNACIDALLSQVVISGGGGNGFHIKADDIDGLVFDGVLSKSAGSGGIYMEPAGANSLIRDIQGGSTVRVEIPTGKGIEILGGSATASDNWSRINMAGARVVSPTSTAFQIGDASKIVRSVDLTGCIADGTLTGVTAFHVNAQRGSAAGCRARGATIGIDLEDSEDFDVVGGSFRDCTTGIDASALTAGSDSTATGVVLKGCTTPISYPTVDAGFEAANNPGAEGKMLGGMRYFEINAAAGTGTKWTYTIPGGTLSKAGDGLEIRAIGERAAGAGTTVININVDGNGCASSSTTLINSHQQLKAFVFLQDDPDAASNTDVWGQGIVDGSSSSGTNQGGNDSQGLTIDWTADVDITITTTDASSLFLVKSGFVRMFAGQPGGA